jgi:GT2 family glycosyltransferase
VSARRVHALLAAHDRREHTLACLERLEAQRAGLAAELAATLVDDGSRDGTGATVRERFPWVRVVDGTGQLFWNGGMRLAFEVAGRADPDFYLFLNDDTNLAPGAVASMIATHDGRVRAGDRACIVVGSTRDPASGRQSYGGWLCGPWYAPGRFKLVEPGPEPRACHTMNGNCVLVPREVARRVGNLDPAFTHSMGDIDYGLRALRAGCMLWVAPGYVGECVANSGRGLWSERALPWRERWSRLLGPKGLPPREWLAFTRRHSGPLWPAYFGWPYLRNGWRALRSLARPK